MTIFYDTEFIESGPDAPIQLISIGMISPHGELYLQNHDFNYSSASEWVQHNVLDKLTHPTCYQQRVCVQGDEAEYCPWFTRAQIAERVRAFVLADWKEGAPPVRLVAHFADYDHVVLSQLYGAMDNLPKGFPFWTLDLKQELDRFGVARVPIEQTDEHNALSDARWVRDAYTWLVREHVPALLERNALPILFGGFFAPGMM